MLKNLGLSLSDLVGADYAEHVCRASAALGLGDLAELRRLANDPVDFFNHEKHKLTRKKFMEVALIASMRCSFHEFFSCHFVHFVVKKNSSVTRVH